MKHRGPRQQRKSEPTPHHHPPNHCRAMVLVDGTAIRKKIKKDYDKALRDLANSKQQIDQFHQTDVPEFTRWLNTKFGALLTELRELSQKLAVDEALVFQVENEVFFGGGTYARAYQRVMEARENPEPPPSSEGPKADQERQQEPFGGSPNFEESEGEQDPVDAFFNEFFGEFEPGEGPRENYGQNGRRRQKPSAPPNASARVKELYRALVRRLHPDTQQEMTPQKAEWWHQAQEAYQAGDADQLEVILTLCEIGDSGTTTHTSATLLQRITAQLKSSLRELKRQIAERRQDPAWGFSRRADHEVMALQMHRTLTGDLEEMRYRWREIQEMITGWKAAAARIKPRRSRRAGAQSREFPF